MPHIDLMTAGIVVFSVVVIFIYAKMTKSSTALDEKKADDYLQQAHAARQRGEHDHQEYLLTKALELYESGVPGDFTKRSSAMVHLADVVARRGDPAEARKTMDKLLSYWRSILDKGDADRLTDVDYFIATADFGSATHEISEFYTEVIERKKQMFGPVHDEVANSMVLQSRLLFKLGEKEKAQELEAAANEMRGQINASKPTS